MNGRPIRSMLLQAARLGFAVCTLGAVAATLAYAFDQRNGHRFISQMNDAGNHGGVIMAFVMFAALAAGVVAALHGRTMAAVLRFLISALIYVLMTTKATSGDHLVAYGVVVVLYVVIAIFTVMAVADSHDTFVGLSILFGILALIVTIKFLMGGPQGQKVALMFFLAIEVLSVFVCFPRRIAWFAGLDGT